MAKEEEIEGMYTLVGDPENPELEETNTDKTSLMDRIQTMKKKLMKDDFDPTDEQRELAEKAYEKALEVVTKVTPTRVVIASIFMAALMFSIFALGFWVIPRDSVSVDVVYKQGSSGGHVVLMEVHNFGSRGIANVEVDASFYDADGEVLNSTSFGPVSMMAHTSIAGDELEIVITGASIWEVYFIEVELDYDSSCCGPISKHVWTIEVGEYTFESHRLDAERNWL
ncbi:MAG: hypothetical protein CMB50_02975 [Euryarchaeota archaeon]|nr:hypothetical protein [Euryarchaeota archaeon]|tara:strand:+ start:1409 stop:2086 length:678 start_codon:yes stop_codon:yes gene_type:complete